MEETKLSEQTEETAAQEATPEAEVIPVESVAEATEEAPAEEAAEATEEAPAEEAAPEEPQESKKAGGPLWKKIAFYGVFATSLTVFIISALFIIRYMVDSGRQNNEYDDLAGILESIRATLPTETLPPETTGTTEPSGDIVEPTEPEPTEPVILPEYAPIYEMNNDLVGWITVPDTKINYPVLQTPDNPNYYLRRNFDKKRSDWGAIYVKEDCDVNAPSDNLTLYGHHMKDGSMFAGLDKFKKKAFWENHRTFTFDTLYEHHTYEIIACFKTTGNLDKGFAYHQMVNAESEEAFNEYISTIKKMAYYETGVTAQYGDKLLCLSTCEYTQTNGRFVVVAKRIS